MKRSLFLSLVFALCLSGVVPASGRAAADSTYEDMKMLVEVLNLIRDNYVQDIETRKIVYGAASGMVRRQMPSRKAASGKGKRTMKRNRRRNASSI